MTKKNFNIFAIAALAFFVGIVAYFSWYKSPCCGDCTAAHQHVEQIQEEPLNEEAQQEHADHLE